MPGSCLPLVGPRPGGTACRTEANSHTHTHTHTQKKRGDPLHAMDWIDLLHQIGNVLQQETEVDSIDPLPWRTGSSNTMDRPPCTTACASGQHPREQPASRPIATTTCFDVVCGRGQGVQRLPGNRRYRELVAMNKVRWYCLLLNWHVDYFHVKLIQLLVFGSLLNQPIYARCHKGDKRKVCKVSQ